MFAFIDDDDDDDVFRATGGYALSEFHPILSPKDMRDFHPIM